MTGRGQLPVPTVPILIIGRIFVGYSQFASPTRVTLVGQRFGCRWETLPGEALTGIAQQFDPDLALRNGAKFLT